MWPSLVKLNPSIQELYWQRIRPREKSYLRCESKVADIPLSSGGAQMAT
jgi:hypothetical protein